MFVEWFAEGWTYDDDDIIGNVDLIIVSVYCVRCVAGEHRHVTACAKCPSAGCRYLHRLSVGHRTNPRTVSLPEKNLIPLSLSISLNWFATTFHPDPCVSPIQIFWPDHPALLATFLRGPFPFLHCLPVHIRSVDELSNFKRQLKSNLLLSAFTV